MTVTDWYK
jgi:hypothetical protein